MTYRRLVVVPKPLDSVPRAAPVAPPGGVIDPGWAPIGRRLAAARAEHLATLDQLRAVLAELAPAAEWVAEPSPESLAGAALVITVGGDGTFLTAARHAGRTPLLGVNSSPTTSIGHYCLATAETFASALGRALGHLDGDPAQAPTALSRIRAEIGDTVLPFEALNDVLFANRSPVASTRYGLHIGDESTLQLSSGIWIATASGSTAAIRSAGGVVMQRSDPRLQWRVREPFVRAGCTLALTEGLTDLPIEILSRSDKNALFLDGQSEPHIVPFGTRARLSRAPDPLFAFLP
ncbi:MAG: NAD(+)/NADH kinase [Myxococcota bacterium]